MDDTQAMALLQQLAVHSAGAAGLEAILDEVCEAAIALSGADFGNVQLVDPETEDLRIAAHRGFPAWWIEFWNAEAKGHGVCGSAVGARSRVIVEDVESCPLFAGQPSLDVQLRAGVRAVQSTPLLTRTGRPVGVFNTHFRQPHRPDAQVLRRLDLLARLAADLIENAQVASALQRSEARFRALVMATTDVVYSMNPDGSGLRMLEGKAAVADGPGAGTDWLERYIEPADRPLVTGAIQEAIRSGSRFDLVHRVRRTDGTHGWMHSRAVPLRDGAGHIVEWFGTASDVTESRLATERLFDEQQRLQALLESLPVGVAFTDSPDCRHVTGNRVLLEQFGAVVSDNVSASAPEEQAHGRQVVYLHEGRQVGADELPLQRAAREGRTIEPMELQVLLPQGRELFIEVCGAPIRNAQGEVIGAVTVSTDVTERKRAAETREQARLKDEFLAVLGHELRNPLAAISTAVDLLRFGVTAAQREATDQLVRDQVSVIRRLVDDLLDISRITLGGLHLLREAVSLSDLLESAAAAARPVAAQRSQRVLVFLPAADVRFAADRVRLQQVLGNLLDNACKYSGTGGRIELSGRLEGREVVLRCRDSGPGVPPAEQERIFEPLVRLEAARRDAPGGLGFGLALVRRLAQLHGGSATVHNRGHGEGSEFVVRIPYDQAIEIPPPRGPAPGQAPAAASLSIAIVEEDADVAQTLTLAMEQRGHRVSRYADATSALAALPGLAPDAVLIHAGLPGMSGLELLAALRGKPSLRNTTFIGTTVHAQAAECPPDAARFDHFLLKPVDLDHLGTLLAAHPAYAAQRRVLLVDDHAELASATAELLRSEGLEVVTASGGQAALHAAPGFRPHVLLCDMGLPDIDGLAVVEKLRDQLAFWGTRVVMVTALSEAELRPFRRMARQLGVDEFIAKPVTREWVRSLAAPPEAKPTTGRGAGKPPVERAQAAGARGGYGDAGMPTSQE